jgi:hypothetical protein
MLLRRRLLGIRRMVTITFYGNGGLTASNEDIVTETVPAGTVWGHMIKPKFVLSGTAKQQNGFTLSQGDDDTLVESDLVITRNIIVYASYSVVEIGVITHAGEVMSVQSWINTYGQVSDEVPTGCYVKMEPVYGGYRIDVPDERKKNLVRYMYTKASATNAMAVSVTFTDTNGVNFGDSSLSLGGEGLLTELLNIPGFYVPDSTEVRDYYNYNQQWWNIYPLTWEPPLTFPVDYNVSPKGFPPDAYSKYFTEQYGDGETMTDIFYNIVKDYTSSNGITGSPGIDIIRGWPLPPGVTHKFHVASVYELSVFKSSHARLMNEIINPLMAWSKEFAKTYTFDSAVNSHPGEDENHFYSYYENITNGGNMASRKALGFYIYCDIIRQPTINMFRRGFGMTADGNHVGGSDAIRQIIFDFRAEGHAAIGSNNTYITANSSAIYGVIPCNLIELFE